VRTPGAAEKVESIRGVEEAQNYNRTSTSSTTGITIQGNGTGISVQGNGAGGAQNVPPAFVANAFIYAGV